MNVNETFCQANHQPWNGSQGSRNFKGWKPNPVFFSQSRTLILLNPKRERTKLSQGTVKSEETPSKGWRQDSSDGKASTIPLCLWRFLIKISCYVAFVKNGIVMRIVVRYIRMYLTIQRAAKAMNVVGRVVWVANTPIIPDELFWIHIFKHIFFKIRAIRTI